MHVIKKDNIETIYVPEYLKQILPYHEGQSVSYLSSGGGTIDAVVKINSYYSTVAACASCEMHREEAIEYTFNVANVYNPFVRIGIDNRPNIFMTIFSPAHDYKTGSGFDFLTETNIAQPISNGPRQTCHASMVLNGKTYNNVLEILNGSDPGTLSRAYYTVDKGLIGFSYSGGGYIYTLVE
ncbi:MAG: hypothetical protein QM737_23505 [Ferruginibacter sp.]